MGLYHRDFQHLQRQLLRRGTFPVPGDHGLMAYARIDVRGIPDFTQSGKNTEEKKQTEKRRTQQVLRKQPENTE